MNYTLIITGLIVVLIGTFLTGLGWNWEKIKGKTAEASSSNTVHNQTSGNQSPIVNIEHQNIILPNESSVSEEKNQDLPLKDFVSSYTLAADMNIQTDYVHVKGISVRGNVNVEDSEGVELKEMKIYESDNYNSKGKINIEDSKDFSIDENTVADEININRSESFDVTKNTVGEIIDSDMQAQENMNNILIGKTDPTLVMLSLTILQQLIAEDNNLANKLGIRIKNLNDEKNGYYKNIILRHFEILNIETLQKAEKKNVGMAYHWLNYFLHFD